MTMTFATPVLETDRLILRAPRIEDFVTCEAFLTSDRAQVFGGSLARQLGAVIDPEAALPVGDDPAKPRVWRHRKGADS
ncbi:hypothetical protein [Tropicimonas sp. IMCC34043]|uniref:hypothetical protein n=1 Tax=Tropicimonas sp. IMCC34043 TaxID=2248760 RepID=UPI0013009D06|nr:hypothetical protein [Tropicimonas sp. IMCC34043]